MVGHALGQKKLSAQKPAQKKKFFGFKLRTQSIITQNFRHTPRHFTPVRSGTLNQDVPMVQHFDTGTYNQNSAEHVAQYRSLEVPRQPSVQIINSNSQEKISLLQEQAKLMASHSKRLSNRQRSQGSKLSSHDREPKRFMPVLRQ